MSFTEEQKKEIRHMVETHPGWKHLEKWMDEVVKASTDVLVEKDNEAVRGEIKAFRRLKKKVYDSLKKYEEESKEED